MEEMKIEYQTWIDAVRGNSNNPVGDKAIIDAANEGKLIVIGTDGKDYFPVRYTGGEGPATTWGLNLVDPS